MTYTNAWSSINPVGTDSAANADDDIRKLRLDIEERMADLFGSVANWTTDPITSAVTRYQFLHWSDGRFFPTGVSNLAIASNALAGSAIGTFNVYFPILLPRGAVITAFQVQGLTELQGTITIQLRALDTTGAVADSVLATLLIPAASVQGTYVNDMTGTPLTIDNTPSNYKYYYFLVTLVNSSGATNTKFDGIRIRYTVSKFNQAI